MEGFRNIVSSFGPGSGCRVIPMCAAEAANSVVWCLCCGNLVGEVIHVLVNHWSSE